MSLSNIVARVREFHVAFGHPFSKSGPREQPYVRANSRADWLIEEAEELRASRNIYDQADAYIDSIYFAIGGLVDMGLDPDPIFDIVHSANMAKIHPDGTVKTRPDGKIIKPEGWIAPDELIIAEIDRQIREWRNV